MIGNTVYTISMGIIAAVIVFMSMQLLDDYKRSITLFEPGTCITHESSSWISRIDAVKKKEKAYLKTVVSHRFPELSECTICGSRDVTVHSSIYYKVPCPNEEE